MIYKIMKNIKKTLRQLDLLPLPEKEKILVFNSSYEHKPTTRYSMVVQLIPVYFASALILAFLLGFIINKDNLSFGNSNTTFQITIETAEQIAIEKVGGGIITEIELNRRKGIMIYDTEVLHNGIEYEVDIAAATGEIIKFKIYSQST